MTLRALDYPREALAQFGRERLLMECDNELEELMRVVACAKEPLTVALIEGLPAGSILWDVGANVGSYTLLAAALGLGVVAFEPVPENFAALSRNLALNNLLKEVVLLPIGLGQGHGLLWLHRGDMRAGAASHTIDAQDLHAKGELHRQLIPVMSMDDALEYFNLPPPTAIKLDVDGFEIQVLAGAEKTLALPSLGQLLIELHDSWDGYLTGWLAERGWQVAETWEHRGPIYYGRFERVVAPGN